jgi:hypothetical protein
MAASAGRLARQLDKVRSVIVTGQFSAVDNLPTGVESFILMADLHHLDRRPAPPQVHESARLLRLGRRRWDDGSHLPHDHANSEGYRFESSRGASQGRRRASEVVRSR